MVNNNLVEIHNNVSIGNEQVNSVNDISITTLEIAELTGKEHFNVLRDTKKMLIELYGERGLIKFEESYINQQNKPQPMYRLPKKEALCLVAGYNIQLRMKIIERLEYLENQLKEQTIIKPMTLKESLLLNLELVEKNEQLTIENTHLKEINTEQNKILTSYSLTEKSRRSKQQLWNDFVSNIKKYSIMYNNSNFSGTYNIVYSEFAKAHQFNCKVSKDLIMKNIDYICECNSIILSLLGERLGI